MPFRKSFVPASPAKRWATQRNWTLFRLRGSYVSIPLELMDKTLKKLSSQINCIRQEMISHIEISHATYEESKKTRCSDYKEEV